MATIITERVHHGGVRQHVHVLTARHNLEQFLIHFVVGIRIGERSADGSTNAQRSDGGKNVSLEEHPRKMTLQHSLFSESSIETFGRKGMRWFLLHL